MDEYPDSEEEFELLYGDDLEVLREQGDTEKSPKKSRKSLDFTPNSTTGKSSATSSQNLFENAFTPLEIEEPSNSYKRSMEVLYEDIGDILYQNKRSKKHKSNEHDDDFALIEHILELRRLVKLRDAPEILNKDYTSGAVRDKYNLSYSVPKYPFIPVNRHDGKRVYIRFHSEQFEEEERLRVAEQVVFNGNLTDKKVWDEAQMIMDNQLQSDEVTEISDTPSDTHKELWVELYKPKKYFELLSDQGTNRIMLRWVKLWDKVVFKRHPKIKIKKANNPKFQELIEDLDEDGRPHHKVALLCGPPGLGKTTLAHMVARHAGYNVIEVNASDERNTEAFKMALENATQMRSVLDVEKRPNCLIFDEIDGAPSASIDYLVKYIQGASLKGRKKNQSKANVLKRPIICICNDAYVPSLRPLRQIAFIVNFPATSNTRLAERLMQIARWQHIKTDMGAMLALAEKSNSDIRSSLSVLHFFKAKGQVTLGDVNRATVGQKDSQKGLFSVWQDIFLIDKPKNNTQPTLKERFDKIVRVISSFGDYDKVAQGVFENYPNLKYKNTALGPTCQALEWFCFNDSLNKQIYTLQEYSLSNYLQYAFVMWHFVFSGRSWQKLQYPNAGFEVRMKENKQKAIIEELMRGIQPTIRPYVQPVSLKLDILPLLSKIIAPTFRPINLHLYTQEEKKSLDNVVGVMIDYNLNYVQERTADGTYVYKLDPNIEELVSFGPKNSLSYSNKQLIAQEIEKQKMRRFEKVPRVVEETRTKKSSSVPNHLQTLSVKSVGSVETAAKDFFGRTVTRSSSSSGKASELKNDIWYKYKEGYNNAVRKKIIVASLK